ncbi:MBL fold metallo-hydrolase RNA specificity domain-containing protein [Ornithinimicrobium tianjinense]|uniref:MBL fold hydrolase n=1 Tax=Ornithinimicrobium tianjinense TaxID=1195761 RepID=A0A917BUQ4_9MICO|nr:MBL fold metallo-hydrolase [Ornithinimicrobium tianjinense]GGF58125.1 MBL fold hydrolase [Ornithinimicrobium tianjinense]
MTQQSSPRPVRNRPLTLTFLGASGTVTGSKYLLTVGERRVLVDAGVFQGEKHWRLKNWEEFPVDPATLSDVVLTHAHTDHIGYLPALVDQGFAGQVWLTEGSAVIGEIVLRDAGKLQEEAAEEARRHGWSKHEEPQPLFDLQDVERTLPLFRTVAFDEDVDLGDGLVARWTRAGHILGSASVRLEVDGHDVLFSGDLGRHDHPLLKPRGTPAGARYVVCESTYGDREHPEPVVEHQAMADAVRRTVDRGGLVVIPAFAVDRTQAVLKVLVTLMREGRIPEVDVAVDSPMALKVLDAYRNSSLGELRDDVDVDDFTALPRLIEAATSQQSRALNRRNDPMIIVASSGMAEGGRVLHHLARLLPDERNTVILTGYQAAGTRGRALEEGAGSVKINGHYVKVRAEIVRDHEFSVHGDASDLVDWLTALDPVPDTVFVTHGEQDVAEHFAARVEDTLGCPAVVPRYGEVVSLVPGAPDPADLDLPVPAQPGPGEEPKD